MTLNITASNILCLAINSEDELAICNEALSHGYNYKFVGAMVFYRPGRTCALSHAWMARVAVCEPFLTT